MFDVDAPVLQPVWGFILEFGQPAVSHFLFPAWLGLASFTLTCLYFSYKDLRRDTRTKIDPTRWPSLQDMRKAAIPQLGIYIGANAISTWAFPRFVDLPTEAPSLLRLGLELIACLLISDFLIYWEHRVMHLIPFLRRRIHSVHHAYAHPFSWAGGWVHPLEDMVVIGCVMTPVLLLGVHPLSFWLFVAIWVAFLIEEHSGHDVWWSPFRWLPLSMGGGGLPHDPHHNISVTKNYGFVFAIWDQLFGTFMTIEEAQARRDRRKRAK
ncbi:MAG: sterol desaturase family protein [Myxococcota bacterium]